MKREHRIALGLGLLLAAILLLGSCKSVQVVEKVNYRDSTILHHKYDTTRITITDTLHVTASNESEKESDTDIVFGAGGGTYNTQTGEATNVIGVKQSKKEKELQQLVLDQKTTIDQQSATISEQSTRISSLQSELEKKQNTADIQPKRSGYARFTSWWFWITAILLLLRFLWWIADYIPPIAPYKRAIQLALPFQR